MTKIKLIGAIILLLVIVLASFSKYIAMQNSANLTLLKQLSEQKAFTQEVSKNIFYIYKNKDASAKQLDESIKLFVSHINQRENVLDKIQVEELNQQTKYIVQLWNDFYLLVQNFRDKNKIYSPYTNIILAELVNNIYKKNLKLVMEIDKLIAMHKSYYEHLKKRNRFIQITLFTILLLLLLYFFTQLKELIHFIQKFLQTSKKIIQKSTVKGLESIELHSTIDDVSKASENFNFLVNKIETSIDIAAQSINNTTLSLEQIEKNVEDLLELIDMMDSEDSLDKELIKREDSIIEALDELSRSAVKLQNLQKELKNLKK